MAETAAYYKYSHLWTGSLKLVVSSQQKMRIKLDSLSLDRNEHSNDKKSVCNKKLPKDKEIFHFFSRKKSWLPVWPLRSSYLSSLEKRKKWCSTYKMVGKTPTCSFLGFRGYRVFMDMPLYNPNWNASSLGLGATDKTLINFWQILTYFYDSPDVEWCKTNQTFMESRIMIV